MDRFVVVSVLALAVWLVNFYGVLSWLQPLLLGGQLDRRAGPLVGGRVNAPGVWLDDVAGLSLGAVRPLSISSDGGLMNTETIHGGAVPQPERLSATTPLVNERLVLWYYVAAMTYMIISMLGGLLMALQLVHWNPLNGIELLSPGRWRMVHTNAIAYGFLANAFLGSLHWAVPRLTLRPVFSNALSYFIFVAWQVVVLSTAAGILLGQAQGVEWGETPVWIDPLALAGLLLVAINFMVPIGQAKGPLYVTLWYFMAAFVWTFLTYAMGNFIPQYVVSGTSAGAIGGLFIHDLVGLFVTPLGWGLMYYFVPIILQKPIWSHGLSLVGFWGIAFFYPLQGIHHFLYTPIPMFLQYGAIVATIAVEFVVTTVIINFHYTLKGDYRQLFTNLPIRWFYTGMMFYFITCFQWRCKRRSRFSR